MKYHALEATFDNENFHDITKEDWDFDLHYIDTPHGVLELETVDIRDKGSMVGLEFSTEGYFSIGDFSNFKGDDRNPYITKVAVLRQPHNVWLWIYMFDENDQQVAVFCGYDDLDGLKHYIDEIIEYTDEDFDEDESNIDTKKQYSQNSKEDKLEVGNIFPLIFESNQHQRYENDNPVQGLQECPRTVKVEKNVSGCSGYQLINGDGYIVRMINGDTGKPQMSAKPMRIVKSNSTEIVLRGYKVNAMTPFGYQEVDMGDYGLTIHLKEKTVVKCVLHMYDRNVDIEYRKVEIVSDFMTDRYAKMVKESSFNPFNITLNPILQKTLPMPNFVETFRSEIQDMFDKLKGIPSDKIYYLFKGYIFNLVESYYNNAGYVPKKIVDKLIEQAYEAINLTRYGNAIPSLDTVKYQVYYGFLHE